jgi:Sulfatase
MFRRNRDRVNGSSWRFSCAQYEEGKAFLADYYRVIEIQFEWRQFIMQKRSRIVSHAFVSVWAIMIAALSPWAVNTQGKKPNFVAIMTDDVGWGDLGSYGGGIMRGAPIPNLDRMAAEGRFMRARTSGRTAVHRLISRPRHLFHLPASCTKSPSSRNEPFISTEFRRPRT